MRLCVVSICLYVCVIYWFLWLCFAIEKGWCCIFFNTMTWISKYFPVQLLLLFRFLLMILNWFFLRGISLIFCGTLQLLNWYNFYLLVISHDNLFIMILVWHEMRIYLYLLYLLVCLSVYPTFHVLENDS